MEINNYFEPTPQHVKVAAEYYQKVYETRSRIENREKTIANNLARMRQLLEERDEVFSNIIALKEEIEKDKIWLSEARPPFEEREEAKIFPLLFPKNNNQTNEDTAA